MSPIRRGLIRVGAVAVPLGVLLSVPWLVLFLTSDMPATALLAGLCVAGTFAALVGVGSALAETVSTRPAPAVTATFAAVLGAALVTIFQALYVFGVTRGGVPGGYRVIERALTSGANAPILGTLAATALVIGLPLAQRTLGRSRGRTITMRQALGVPLAIAAPFFPLLLLTAVAFDSDESGPGRGALGQFVLTFETFAMIGLPTVGAMFGLLLTATTGVEDRLLGAPDVAEGERPPS